MLMENSNTRKYNDANDSDQQLGPSTSQCFAKLRDTGQFSRLLANWCYDSRHREDSDTWTATGSKVCSEFSSRVNIKVQHRPYNLSQNLCRNKKKCKQRSSKTISQRNNGLSYFLRVNEQFKRNYEDSSRENTLKLQKQDTATAFSTAGTGQVFASNGGETVFDFKHFADPEEIVLEYINTYVYKKSRLEKVDKKKISDSIIELRNILKDNSAESNEPRIENILHGDKLGIKVIKLGKRLSMNKFTPQRTTATSNFVFELGALDEKIFQNDRTHEVNTSERIKDRRTAFNGQGKARVSTNERKVCSSGAKKCTSLLPELSSAEVLRADCINKSGEKFFFGTNTVLPDIERCWKNSSGIENKTKKRVENRRKPIAQVDRDAAISKSNWQKLKQKRKLTYGNDCINSSQTRKLSDTLEKISNRICREQRSYSDGKTDNYYGKEAIKTLRENGKKDREDLLSEVLNNRSKNAADLNKNGIKYGTRNLLKLGKEDRSQTEADHKSEVEKYLDGPSQALNGKSSGINHEEEITYPSSKVVADMLTKLNIYDVGFHINAKEDEESVTVATDLMDYKNSGEVAIPEKLNSIPNCKPAITAGGKALKIMVPDKREWEIENGLELFGSEDKSLSGRKQTFGTSQTDKIAIRNNNAFIKMGLKGLEGRIPRHLGTQILKSDFLKRDLSFKPARFLNRSVNFNNTLNSGWNLTDSIENSGSVTSQRGKWLKQKIRRFIANSTKEGKETSKINESSKVDNDYKKLYEIIEKKFTERKDKTNFVGTTKDSFVQKFFKVQTGILFDPRLQAVLPGLLDGIPNLPERLTR